MYNIIVKKITEKADILLEAIANIKRRANKFQISDLKRIEKLTSRIKAGEKEAKDELKKLFMDSSCLDNNVLDMETEEGYTLQKYIDDLVLEVEEFEGYSKE